MQPQRQYYRERSVKIGYIEIVERTFDSDMPETSVERSSDSADDRPEAMRRLVDRRMIGDSRRRPREGNFEP